MTYQLSDIRTERGSAQGRAERLRGLCSVTVLSGRGEEASVPSERVEPMTIGRVSPQGPRLSVAFLRAAVKISVAVAIVLLVRLAI